MLFLKFSIFSGSENNLMELQERFSKGNLRLPSCFGAYDLLKAKQFKLLIYLRVFQSVRKQLPFPAPAANFIYLLVISLCEWHKSSFVYFLFLQITEALSFLHYSGQVIHKNVCPSSILVTKKGTWKLAGFEFIGKATTYFFILAFRFFTWFDKRSYIPNPREMPWIWRCGACCLSTVEHKIVENGSTKSRLYGWVERKKLYPPSKEKEGKISFEFWFNTRTTFKPNEISFFPSLPLLFLIPF